MPEPSLIDERRVIVKDSSSAGPGNEAQERQNPPSQRDYPSWTQPWIPS